MNLLKQRSVQTFFIIATYLFLAPYLPLDCHRSFYSISLFLKDILLWMLPFTVCTFIAHAISSFEKRALTFVFVLIAFEALSNLASVWYAFSCGHFAASSLHPLSSDSWNDDFSPLWRLPLTRPLWWTADKGSFLGLSLGLLAALRFPSLATPIARAKTFAEKISTRIFAKLIPLFLLGFITKLYQTNLLKKLGVQYADFLFWLIGALVIYIFVLFWIGSKGSLSICARNIRHLLPAGSVAFSSGCSLSTMPWTIEGSAKTLQTPELARAIIPATTNIQQIGDCIANTFLCFLLYVQFMGHAPSFSMWVSFSIVFVLARFATAAVLGGAIFVMLPIYETHLHFSPEMIAIILAFNVILDPIITSANVLANGALCRIFEMVWVRDRKTTTT